MSKRHPSGKEIAAENLAPIEKLRRQVEWMELNVKKNELQHKLTGYAVDARLDSFVDIEIHLANNHPEVLPGFTEERNIFLSQVGIDREHYNELLQRDIESRVQSQRPTEPGNNPEEPPIEEGPEPVEGGGAVV